MKRGFTIIELLVASMLLGIIVTILTMVFNQSSIAWRIGVAGVTDMDDVRDNMAAIREEADNVFAYDGKVYRHVGLWDTKGNLHLRAACGRSLDCTNDDNEKEALRPNVLLQRESQLAASVQSRNPWSSGQNVFNVGNAERVSSVKNYIVNVMSGGPKNDINDWQAIWSFPDDFE